MAFQRRTAPSCAARSGTRARRIKRRIGRAGVPCSGEARAAAGTAASLDTDRYLATTCSEWLRSLETPEDRALSKHLIKADLEQSLKRLHDEGINERRFNEYKRVQVCQQEFLAFRCCKNGRILAVPIGCNHKLCPLCGAHRAEKYRARVQCLFDRLEIPWFLTLTVPNVRRLSKRTFSTIRGRTRKLLKLYEPWIKGGLYSIETTWNRKTETWHAHVHVLLDARFAPPSRRSEFIRFKRGLEFTWLRLTGGREWRPGDFEYWFQRTCHEQPTGWNRQHRRVLDVRPVRDRKGAAYEVLKYITKVSDFVDDPNAVEEFLRATRGVRMLQTFGTWYGFKFDAPEGAAAGLKCTAGCTESHWRQVGRFFAECVEKLPGGVLALREGVIQNKGEP